jgi:hypothetical protein
MKYIAHIKTIFVFRWKKTKYFERGYGRFNFSLTNGGVLLMLLSGGGFISEPAVFDA